MISRYFEPNIFNDIGYMPFISVTEKMFELVPEKKVEDTMWIMKNAIEYF